MKIIIKINIIFYLPKDKLRENLKKYESLTSHQERSYLNCILYFKDYIHKSLTFETIKNKAYKSLFSFLNILPFKYAYDNLSLNKHFNSLYYLHEELVYYILSYNKSKHIISCFDNFMQSSKLEYDNKDEMSNRLLMNNFVLLWSLDFSNANQTEELTTINKIPHFKVVKQEDVFQIKTLKQKQLNFVIPSSSENSQGLTESSNQNQSSRFRLDLNSIRIFRFKILKRETIDKVTISYFRRVLNKSKQESSNDDIVKGLTLGLHTPPFKYNELYFKSINASYLFWLFNNAEVKSLFEEFIENHITKLCDKIISKKEQGVLELPILKRYLLSMTKVYTLSNYNLK